jgi:hypothetical protein
MTSKITKVALIGAVLVSMLSAASAQTFNGTSHDNDSAYSQQQAPTDSPARRSEGGGA